MADTELVKEYIKECQSLIQEWQPRRQEFIDSYNLLALKDENAVSGLESFVANDPRVLYNMALFLLTPQSIPYNIPFTGNVPPVQQDAISLVEGIISNQWDLLDERSKESANGGSWLYAFNSILLSTGWYSIFAIASGDEAVADIWHPAEVFPKFSQDGLAQVVHYYKESASAVRRKLKNSNWLVGPRDFPSEVPLDIYDYWDYDIDGNPHNCIIIGDKIAKKQSYPELERIPVIVGAVNGLPDRGSLSVDLDYENDWHATMGQSIVTPLKTVFKAYNRQNTFLQQILRDSAQPRIIERTKSKGVVTSQNWDKRGAIFHLDVDEDIHTLAMPGMPPEMTVSLQNMQGMIQRGGIDYSLFQGGQASGYAQALTSASAQQILLAFKQARDHVVSTVSNMWLSCIKNGMVKFEDFNIPPAFPMTAKFKSDIAISVPGDLIQRATTARQLDPSFKISHATTMALTMPEIKDPNNEIVMARVDQAMTSPVFANLDMVEALTEAADALEAEGRKRHADRYRAYAAKLEQEISGPEPTQAPPGPPGIQNAAQ